MRLALLLLLVAAVQGCARATGPEVTPNLLEEREERRQLAGELFISLDRLFREGEPLTPLFLEQYYMASYRSRTS